MNADEFRTLGEQTRLCIKQLRSGYYVLTVAKEHPAIWKEIQALLATFRDAAERLGEDPTLPDPEEDHPAPRSGDE